MFEIKCNSFFIKNSLLKMMKKLCIIHTFILINFCKAKNLKDN